MRRYAYDFLGLLEVQLLRDWATHIDANGGALPEGKIFSSEELIVVPGTDRAAHVCGDRRLAHSVHKGCR